MSNKTLNISNENTSRLTRISRLLETLRQKIKNFVVLDRQTQLVGEVRDLIIDANRQLSFLISKSDIPQSKGLFLLSSKLVEKIDSQIGRILINVDKSKIEDLPEYEYVDKMEQNSVPQDTTSIAEVTTNTNDERDSIDEIFRLLEERLVVEPRKRKVGEVIVRKEIETRIVQVPVRREKLIVEQVNPEHKQLAEIDLGEEEIPGVELRGEETPKVDGFERALTVSGDFSSPKIASLLLNAIALEQNHGCKGVRVTIFVEDEERQKTYQEWFSRTSKS